MSPSIISGVAASPAIIEMRPNGNDAIMAVGSTPSGMMSATPSIPFIISTIAACTTGPAMGCAMTSPIDDSRVSGTETASPATVTDAVERMSRLDAATSRV